MTGAALVMKLLLALLGMGGPELHVTYAEEMTDPADGLYVEVSDDRAFHLPPCESEDASGCYWYADEFGNGQGESFVVTPEGEQVPLSEGWIAMAEYLR